MQARAPWSYAKSGHHDQADPVIYLCAESLRICGILLQPYMPTKSNALLDMLGVAADARTYKNTQLGSDKDFGAPKIDLGEGLDGVLFPPLTTEFDPTLPKGH